MKEKCPYSAIKIFGHSLMKEECPYSAIRVCIRTLLDEGRVSLFSHRRKVFGHLTVRVRTLFGQYDIRTPQGKGGCLYSDTLRQGLSTFGHSCIRTPVEAGEASLSGYMSFDPSVCMRTPWGQGQKALFGHHLRLFGLHGSKGETYLFVAKLSHLLRTPLLGSHILPHKARQRSH